MSLRPSHRKYPHTLKGQIKRMHDRWPDFDMRYTWDGQVMWVGHLHGWQRAYKVGLLWDIENKGQPYVSLINPALAPRDKGLWDAIPHLMFSSDNPADSGLCLYDPDGCEWSEYMLIADTTLPWAAEWLYFYELWLYDGVWRGGGVGAESVAQARASAIYGATKEHESSTER